MCADTDAEADIDLEAARAVRDVLADQPDNALDRDWLPEETGWSRERLDAAVADLRERGIVAVDDWGEVELVGDAETP